MNDVNPKRLNLFWALFACISIVGCSSGEKVEVPDNTAASATIVETAVISKVNLNTAYDLSGTLQASEERALSFQFGGRIMEANPVVGANIQKSSIIARLDEADYLLQLEQANALLQEASAAMDNAQANIQSAASSLKSAEAGVDSAQANVNKINKGARNQEKAKAQAVVDKAQSAYNKAQADASRMEKLFEAGAATASDNEKAQLAVVSSRADLDQAQNTLSLLIEGATKEDTQSAEAALRNAEAGREAALAAQKQALASRKQARANYEKALVAKSQAELALSRSRMTSPFNGIILKKVANAGELVASGQPIYSVGAIDMLKVLLPVPDNEITYWKKGQQVSLTLYDQSREGTVSNIYPSTNVNTGSINVEVLIPNPQKDWTPGQVVKATRKLSDKQGILVPVEAVIQTGEKPFVYKVEKGKAVTTFVKLGNQVVENKLHITSGLHEGVQIVVKGAGSLFNGDTIQAPKGGKL
jgi:RND family efflux transporter MFP subunit